MFERLIETVRSGVRALDFASPALDLLLRLWVANVFFKSGLTKIANFDSTIALFTDEYQVPVLPPELAAVLGTGAELILPVFIAFGLGTRLAAIALFVFNIVAVISYPGLSEAGVREHTYWGLLMLVTIFHGPGKLSLDHLIVRRWGIDFGKGKPQWAV